MIDLTNEPERLVRKQEYNAAIIPAFTLLESVLRKIGGLKQAAPTVE